MSVAAAHREQTFGVAESSNPSVESLERVVIRRVESQEVYSLRARAQRDNSSLDAQPLPYSSGYYKDLTRERCDIDASFKSNNFYSLRDLPNALSHGVILDNKRARVEKEAAGIVGVDFTTTAALKTIAATSKARAVKLIGGGYFTPFTYNDEVYAFAREVGRFEKIKSLAKRLEVSEQEFKHADNRFVGKWEDPFRNPTTKFDPKTYIFPALLVGDTYDALQESKTRQRLISEALQVAGEFYPSQNERVLRRMTKANIVEIIKALKAIIAADWPEADFSIEEEAEKYLRVSFKTNSDEDDSEEERKNFLLTITVYMSQLLNDERVTPFGLSKLVPEWSKVNPINETISYALKPPWVKADPAPEFAKLIPQLTNQRLPKRTHI